MEKKGAGWPTTIIIPKKPEEDPRRHKSRCIYYNKNTKDCSQIVLKCSGSMHCPYYKEK